MQQLKQLSLTLAALLCMATGAWALPENEVTVTPVTGKTNQWTFTMPAGNVELTPIYAPEFTATFKAGNANTIQDGKATVTVTESGATEGTDVTANIGSDNKLTPLYEGQTITMTAAPGYKFRTVEVKKAAAPRPLAEATAEDLGKIVGADGNIYDTKTDAEAVATGNAVAMIAYVGSSTDHATYTHGLAIALADESKSNWSTAKSTCEGKSAVTNAAWQLPSQNQWKAMFKAFGGNEGSYSGLNTAIPNAGGTALKEDESYWTSTQETRYNGTMNGVYFLYLNNKTVTYDWTGGLENGRLARACLAF